MAQHPGTWWRHFPRTGCSHETLQIATGPGQTPLFAPGDTVRLVGKPGRPRRVLEVRWHAYCHDFVYIVENSQHADCAYWYAPQLISETEWQAARKEAAP